MSLYAVCKVLQVLSVAVAVYFAVKELDNGN